MTPQDWAWVQHQHLPRERRVAESNPEPHTKGAPTPWLLPAIPASGQKTPRKSAGDTLETMSSTEPAPSRQNNMKPRGKQRNLTTIERRGGQHGENVKLELLQGPALALSSCHSSRGVRFRFPHRLDGTGTGQCTPSLQPHLTFLSHQTVPLYKPPLKERKTWASKRARWGKVLAVKAGSLSFVLQVTRGGR